MLPLKVGCDKEIFLWSLQVDCGVEEGWKQLALMQSSSIDRAEGQMGEFCSFKSLFVMR